VQVLKRIEVSGKRQACLQYFSVWRQEVHSKVGLLSQLCPGDGAMAKDQIVGDENTEKGTIGPNTLVLKESMPAGSASSRRNARGGDSLMRLKTSTASNSGQ
ncbi:unnamed protein product, partial [Choristocarpus tenellus]